MLNLEHMKQSAHSKRWLTVKNIADYCMVDRVTVRRWIKAGQLSAIKLPSGHYRIKLGDFRALLERSHIPIEDWLLKSKFQKERR